MGCLLAFVRLTSFCRFESYSNSSESRSDNRYGFFYFHHRMKKKKITYPDANNPLDPELIKMYMSGAANPGIDLERKFSADVVDLHLDQHTLSQRGILPQNALLFQINECEKAIDRAVVNRKTEIRLIHGIGSGKLKNAVAGLLKKHPQVRSFEQKYHPKYGDGSTLIFFK